MKNPFQESRMQKRIEELEKWRRWKLERLEARTFAMEIQMNPMPSGMGFQTSRLQNKVAMER